MTEFYVTTQCLENYGAHGGTGKFADDQSYWKFKSGTDYIVSGLDSRQDAMAFVASICMYNGIGWKEFPSECIPMDEWESKWDMSNEHHVEYRDFKLEYVQRVDPRTFDKAKEERRMRMTLGDF
jgi:hypothetical protein